MPRKSIGERPMTDAERQARCRAARASGTPAVRRRRPLDHRSRAKRWCDAISELTTPPGWKPCQRTYRTAPPPRRCTRSATSTSLNSRQSFRRAASAEIDPRNVRSPPGHSLMRHERGPSWTPIGGAFCVPIDTHHGDIVETGNESWRFKNRACSVPVWRAKTKEKLRGGLNRFLGCGYGSATEAYDGGAGAYRQTREGNDPGICSSVALSSPGSTGSRITEASFLKRASVRWRSRAKVTF